IRSLSGHDFIIEDKSLSDSKRVDISVNGTLEDVLETAFKNRPFTYSIINNAIVIKRKPIENSVETKKAIIQTNVQGKVTDNQGSPLSGVSVLVEGTSKGTSTNDDGTFSLNVARNDVLVFSYVGFVSREIQYTGQTSLSVVLEPITTEMDEIVVIGYGTQKKRDLTGAVTQINAEKLVNESPSSVQDLLRGNVAGLNVGYSASAKSAGSLQVRGRKSLTAGGTPLIVLDGVIYNGSLNDINQQDIETLDILKDASSAAVFGAKAANGVIMITTKKGTKGKAAISFDANYGLATMANDQPIYDAEGYLTFRQAVIESINENFKPHQFADPRQLPADITISEWLAYDASGGDPVEVWLQRLNMKQVEIENYKAGRSIDWYDRVFQTGPRQDYTASLSNSKDDVSYYWSLGYQDSK